MNLSLLENISNLFGPSGFEDEVREFVIDRLGRANVETTIDRLGNVIAHVTPENKGAPKVLVDAHMDEIGVLVKHIDSQGFLKIVTLGGVHASTLISKTLRFRTDEGKYLKGITCTTPLHVRKKDDTPDIDEISVDVGATTAEEAENMGMRVGTPGVIDFAFTPLTEDRILGKALDDRSGCCMLLEYLDAQKGKFSKDMDLYLSFSVQEELGMRGVGAVIEEVQPDFFVAVEGTVCADVPGVPEDKKITRLGKGPAVTIMDKQMVAPQKLIKAVIDLAKKEQIPYQFKTPAVGGTNSGTVHRMKKGIPSLTMATPCRYIHTQASMLSLSDFNHGKRLLEAILSHAKAFC